MNDTIFLSERNKTILLKEIEGGNDAARKAILDEFTRLENRIKELQSGNDSENYITPDEIEL